MATDEPLTTAAAALLAEVSPGTWRSYVSRGQAPPADGHLDGRTPYWLRSTVEAWHANRPGRGTRTDLRQSAAD